MVLSGTRTSHRSIIGGKRPGARVSGSQSVYRAISLLREVARNNDGGTSASVMAERLGLTTGTAHRLLKVLTSEDLLTFDPYSRKYHVGLELYTLGHVARDFAVRDLLASALSRLRDLSSETVFLLIRAGVDSLCLDRIDGDFPIRLLTLNPGSRRPLGIGAGGLALLASESDEVIEKILNSNEKFYRDYADISLDEIREAVRATRARGFSFNDGRLERGVRAVGIAVGPEGVTPPAAVSIATSQDRMKDSHRAELEKFLHTELKFMDWSLLQTG